MLESILENISIKYKIKSVGICLKNYHISWETLISSGKMLKWTNVLQR